MYNSRRRISPERTKNDSLPQVLASSNRVLSALREQSPVAFIDIEKLAAEKMTYHVSIYNTERRTRGGRKTSPMKYPIESPMKYPIEREPSMSYNEVFVF